MSKVITFPVWKAAGEPAFTAAAPTRRVLCTGVIRRGERSRGGLAAWTGAQPVPMPEPPRAA